MASCLHGPAAAGLASRRTIPSLDGLRDVSIALVLLGHTALWTGIRAGPTLLFRLGAIGRRDAFCDQRFSDHPPAGVLPRVGRLHSINGVLGPVSTDVPTALAIGQRRAIPSLDGLRAISIALVLLGHSALQSGVGAGPIDVMAWSELGVSVFFVISGFLITRLLLTEMEAGAGIRLGRFYRRRALRIFPAFYGYLAALGLLWASGWLPEHRGSFIAAATYTWNYYPHAQGWYLNHVWSLCLEEQFYLLWPLCLCFTGRRRSVWLSAAAVAMCPLSRVATYFLWPSMHSHNDTLLHTRIDTILYGCLLALAWDTEWLRRLLHRHGRPPQVVAAAAILAIGSPWMASQFHGAYMDPFGYSLEAGLIAFLIACAVRLPKAWCGRMLNCRTLRHLGVISYSLYLWQQLFLGPRWHAWHWALLLSLGAAETSYFLVERPVLRWRDRRSAPPPAQAASATA